MKTIIEEEDEKTLFFKKITPQWIGSIDRMVAVGDYTDDDGVISDSSLLDWTKDYIYTLEREVCTAEYVIEGLMDLLPEKKQKQLRRRIPFLRLDDCVKTRDKMVKAYEGIVEAVEKRN